MFRVQYLFGILSLCAAALYLLFAYLSMNASTISAFDRTMPFVLCSLHILAGLLLLGLSYRSYLREHKRINQVLQQLLVVRSSLTPDDLAQAASITLAEAHEFLLDVQKKKTMVVYKKHETVVVRAFPPHSLN